ncbi:MAG: hypothetical protein ACYCYE_04860 [Clostridia bacterium]
MAWAVYEEGFNSNILEKGEDFLRVSISRISKYTLVLLWPMRYGKSINSPGI